MHLYVAHGTDVLSVTCDERAVLLAPITLKLRQ